MCVVSKMKTLAQILIFVILLFSASLIWASDKKLSFIGVEKQETVAATETPSYSQNVKKVQANAALDKVSGLQLMTEDQLDAYVARHMSDATPRQRRQFKNKWLAKAKSNELAAAAQRQELDEKSNSKWELSDNTKDYLHRSGQQVLYGNYTDECTALGTAGEIALACTGLDAPGDIRDLSHDLRNPEPSLTWLGKTALDGASLLPLVGVLKHAGKVRKCAIKALKNGDKTCKITKFVAKNGDTVSEAAQGLVKRASKTGEGLKSSKRLSSTGEGVAEVSSKSSQTKRALSNPSKGRFDTDHLGECGYDKALKNARENAGDLGASTKKMYDPETGTLIGEMSSNKKRGWRIDEDHVNYWDWSKGKKGKGGKFGHEFFPVKQAGPHSKHVGYADWE